MTNETSGNIDQPKRTITLEISEKTIEAFGRAAERAAKIKSGDFDHGKVLDQDIKALMESWLGDSAKIMDEWAKYPIDEKVGINFEMNDDHWRNEQREKEEQQRLRPHGPVMY